MRSLPLHLHPLPLLPPLNHRPQVRSRFALPDERSGLAAFRKALTSRGFEAVRVDASNRMFVVVEARRGMGGGEGSAWPALKACEYKRR